MLVKLTNLKICSVDFLSILKSLTLCYDAITHTYWSSALSQVSLTNLLLMSDPQKMKISPRQKSMIKTIIVTLRSWIPPVNPL